MNKIMLKGLMIGLTSEYIIMKDGSELICDIRSRRGERNCYIDGRRVTARSYRRKRDEWRDNKAK